MLVAEYSTDFEDPKVYEDYVIPLLNKTIWDETTKDLFTSMFRRATNINMEDD